MHLTSPTLNQPVRSALACEQHRKQLIDQGRFHQALLTYDEQQDFLPDENTGTFWDKKFILGEEDHPMEQWRTKKVISLIDPQKSVLNLGVGRGFLEHLLFARYPDLNYTGTDITEKTLKKLRQTFNKQFHFQRLEKLTYADESFDQVLLLEVLEHIKPNQTFTVLSEIYRVLKKRGMFIVSVPLNEGLEKMLPENPNSHMRLYSESLIKFELKTAGFTINKAYTAAAFHHFFWLKHFINQLLWLRQPNNIIVICQKQ